MAGQARGIHCCRDDYRGEQLSRGNDAGITSRREFGNAEYAVNEVLEFVAELSNAPKAVLEQCRPFRKQFGGKVAMPFPQC